MAPLQTLAAPTVVTIAADKVFPDSVTSTASGDLIIGSFGKGAIYRQRPMIAPEKATCNDIDVAKDGTAYVTDTGGGQVLRLRNGATALEVWVKDDRLAGADGIALGKAVMYVNSVLFDLKSRVRDVRIGPEGAIYVLTDDSYGRRRIP